jgi:hypothetical protein
LDSLWSFNFGWIAMAGFETGEIVIGGLLERNRLTAEAGKASPFQFLETVKFLGIVYKKEKNKIWNDSGIIFPKARATPLVNLPFSPQPLERKALIPVVVEMERRLAPIAHVNYSEACFLGCTFFSSGLLIAQERRVGKSEQLLTLSLLNSAYQVFG